MTASVEFSSLARDTTRDAMRVCIHSLRQLGDEGRARAAFQHSRFLRAAAAVGVRMRHPQYDDEQVRLATIRLMLGEELFHEVFPDVEVQP